MMRRIRRNPMRFDERYTSEQASDLKRTRAGRSVLSAALRKKSVERMANTPHTFIVVLWGDYTTQKKVRGTPGAVTLGLSVDYFDMVDEARPREGEGIFTAFNYLHRLGDEVQTTAFVDMDIYGRSSAAIFKPLYKMVDDHVRLLANALGVRKDEAEEMYLEGLNTCVNSHMVREGYSANWTQAFADLFPLCELTPPSRALLLPVFQRGESDLPQKAYDVYNNVIVPDFNKRFREFYDAYIPTLYGKVVWVG